MCLSAMMTAAIFAMSLRAISKTLYLHQASACQPEILVRLIKERTMRRPWPYQNRPRQLEFAILERGGRRPL
jgi:hypothetical protein